MLGKFRGENFAVKKGGEVLTGKIFGVPQHNLLPTLKAQG